MQTPNKYRIIFDEMERAKEQDSYIVVELGDEQVKEMNSIEELREIVSECADLSAPIFTTT